MSQAGTRLKSKTRREITEIFDRLDYEKLGPIYCEEGGKAFWRKRRGACRKLGINIAEVLRRRLRSGGRSLYVGAGVAEIPALAAEALELERTVLPCNLRRHEVVVLNKACRAFPFRFRFDRASKAKGTFDHLWMVSVLNDPERFPELSALSYGRANPVTFDPQTFVRERNLVADLAATCLKKLRLPGLVTTSVEEIPWITDWCTRRGIPFVVEKDEYPTAIVGDPVCFIRIGTRTARVKRKK